MTNWEKKGTNDGVLSFEISRDKIEAGLKKTYERVKKNLAVPGFRKGKVPRQLFDQMYGEESLYEDTLNLILGEAYEAAVLEAGIDAVGQPKIDIVKMDRDGEWELTAEVSVKPEVKLGDYKNLKVAKQDVTVTDEDVDHSLHHMQEDQAELEVKEDQAAADGDTVVIDYEGFKDDVPFEGGKADNYSLVLGSNSFIPGFEDQLIGAKSGDEVDVKVTFPEEYHAEDLKGAAVVFKVKVHEVKVKVLPELDDEFAKDVDPDVETLAELKDKIRKDLEKNRQASAEEAVKSEAIEKAVANAEIVDIPQTMIDEETDRQVNQFFGQMQQQGINKETYFQITGTTEEDLVGQYAAGSEESVKTTLVIEAVGEAENIEASEEEIEEEIQSLVTEYNMPEAQIRRLLTPDMLKHDIVMKKSIAVITDSAVEE